MALARALVTNPSVLLLDEPLSALDPFLRVRMRDELKRLQVDLGITFVHVTHSQEEAMALADLVVVMNQGRIEQTGKPQTVYNKPVSHFVARFMGGHNVIRAELRAREEGLARLEAGAGVFHLPDAEGALGSRIDFTVRADKIGLARDGQSLQSRNHLPARVRSVEYQGAWVQVGLEADCADEFSVSISEGDFDSAPVAVGDRVTASWETADAHRLEQIGRD